jgi:hypothetical protein
MSDSLESLPTTNEPPSSEDYAKIHPYLSSTAEFVNARKTYLIAAALFFALSLPFLDKLFEKVKMSPYILLLIKTAVFTIALYLIDYQFKRTM